MFPYPLLNVNCELVGNYREFPAQSRVRIYTRPDETAVFRETWVFLAVERRIRNIMKVQDTHCYWI